MSNSNLVDYRRIVKNHSAGRQGHAIDRIVIHHVAGICSVEDLGTIFSGKRKASATYGIGSDGRIGQYVDEKDRPWTTSSARIDNRAVTIEVSNCKLGPNWEVSDLCLEKTIELCTDICKRNGIRKVTYLPNDREHSILQMHKWWSNTLCPGPYLSSKFPYIAEQINEALSNDSSKASTLYVVQAGAFSSYRNAAKMKNQLRKAGFDGYITKGNLYRVQVGAFKEYANAEALAARLRAKGFTAYLSKKEGSE